MKKVIITLNSGITTSTKKAKEILEYNLYKSGIKNYSQGVGDDHQCPATDVDSDGWAWASVVVELEEFKKSDKRSLKNCMIEIVDVDECSLELFADENGIF